LNLDQEWNLNIFLHEELPKFEKLSIDDLFIWIEKLWQLKNKSKLKKPNINIKITNKLNDFKPTENAINIDFSLFKRYTDENETNLDIIFVRTDYFDDITEKNYFRINSTEPINYKITDEDKPVLEFFLNNIFDKPSFREGQFPIIANALNRKDTIGLLPTGGGKSLCYQLPCLLQPSINIVVCPIKSLMYDQYDNLVNIFINNLHFITSDLEQKEKQKIESKFEKGNYLLVWISPEKFQIPNFRDKISAIVTNFSIAYAVVDEVHCLSEWGHDFRTSYLNLAKTIDKLSPKDEKGEGKIKFIGLTATASVNVLKDIKIEFARQKQSIEDENIKSLLDYSREELFFEVIYDNGNKFNQLIKIINNLRDKENFTISDDKAGIVFTPNVNGEYGCYNIANKLNKIYQNQVNYFSGSVPTTFNGEFKEPIMSNNEFNEYKIKIQKDFKENKYKLLVATKSFGMGIDKQNIFYTFHYGIPSSLEALYQEAGRAGRWDIRKIENKNKIAKCFVLFSPESIERKKIDKLFHKDTTFTKLQDIIDEVGYNGKDIFKQFFLFVQRHNDIEIDFNIILKLIKTYFKENTQVKIFWTEARNKLKINNDILEKAIYRLSILGIVSDWTTDFINQYEVQFDTINEEHIIKSLSYYINKYEPDTDLSKALKQVVGNSILEKAIRYLLKWTFENIVYNRKQSLKTLYDLCLEFKDNNHFKQRINSYFIFSERTFVLQHIAENTKNYEKWFEVLTINNNNVLYKNEFEKLKDSISRFLESYRNSVGLNFISGFVRLVLDDYDNTDGRERLESAMLQIKEKFTKEQQQIILNNIITLGYNLTEFQKFNLSISIIKNYPEYSEFLAEYYNLPYLMNNEYEKNLNKLKLLNKKLYEQLTKI